MNESYSKEVMKHFKNPINMGKFKNPDGVGKVGNVVCILPNTMIQSNDDIKPIENIKLNNRVLSHDGKYHRVIKKFKRKYKGKIVAIKNRFGSNFLTPEHEILAIKVPKTHHFLYLRNKAKLKPTWYHADELEKGDLVLYPILKEIINTKYIPVEMTKLKYDFRSKSIPKKIKITDDFLRLVGYFLAEGHSKEEITNTFISFTFGINEENYADDVVKIIKSIFDLEPKKRVIKDHNTITVTINNVFIARLFRKLFGCKAENKNIPHFMMLLPPEKQKSIILGLWRGDGYLSAKRKYQRAGYSTISYKLIQQIKILLLRQKIIPSIYVEDEKIIKGVKHRRCYRIHIGHRTSLKRLAKILGIQLNINLEERNDSWCDDNYAYIPLTNIFKEIHESFVLNLNIESSSTYVSNSLTLHNCGDVMYLYIKIKKNKKGQDILSDIKFETFGCVAAIATSSMITKLAKGKTIEEALKITKLDVANSLGGLPKIKLHCSVLASDALVEAIYDYLTKNKLHIPEDLEKRHQQIKKETEFVEERFKDQVEMEKEILESK